MNKRFLPLLIVAALTAPTFADSVKIGGFWFDNVLIQSIGNGNIVFTVNGAERVQKLERLEGIKSTAYPGLTEANDALEAGNEDEALEKFSDVAAKARDPWAKHWAMWNRSRLLDKNGTPVDAVEAYMALARETEEPLFLAQPPLAALSRATDEEKRDIARRLASVRRSMSKGATKDAYKQMVEMTQVADAPAEAGEEASKPAATGMTTTNVTAPKPAPAPTLGATIGASGPLESVIPLHSSLEGSDEINRMLAAGQFADALAELNNRLDRREQRMALRLYQRGLARFYLAEKSGDTDVYKDAGVDFMRVAIYFPRSLYKGASLLEAGAVHDKIGRRDIAMQLWQKARVEIDPESEPQLVARLEKLMGADVAPPQE